MRELKKNQRREDSKHEGMHGWENKPTNEGMIEWNNQRFEEWKNEGMR